MTFMHADQVEWDEFDWGVLGWVARPANVPEATSICALDVRLDPGQAHDFHIHPNQQEIIFLRSGSMEQWVGEETTQMGPGDACFVPANTPHGSFVAADAAEPARILVVLSPSYGEGGYEVVDVSTEEPWRSIRQ